MIPDDEVVQYIFRKIKDGYDHLNANGIMHRDLKPDNILIHYPTREDERTVKIQSYRDVLRQGGVIKIADFGLSHVLSTDSEKLATVEGTKLYWSPEYFYPKPVYDKESEMFSLGEILFELKTGKHPFFS